ncbi:hypothetical protein JCM19000A_42510 [Silvimonas sp. JCM 19000]
MTPTKRPTRTITLRLPDEFLDVCEEDCIAPETVLRGFVADLAGIISWAANPRTDGYNSNGSHERSMAREYYERVGYPWWNR